VQVSLTKPNFAQYAELCGALGETVQTRDELEAGMARMMAATSPYLLHIAQDGVLV
jgi:thiamine pyrophosphate-dependent acetolactate synthase large subunit-like protein